MLKWQTVAVAYALLGSLASGLAVALRNGSPFSHPAPQDRTPLLMNFQHVALSFFARIAKHALEHHGDIRHQVHRHGEGAGPDY